MAKAEEAAPVESAKPKPRFETLRAIFWAALIALAIRSFVIEPFKIPSGSMIPTLLVGDYVLVNKFAYGLRLPFTGTLLIPIGAPKRGDVVVFRFPDDPREDYIKRVIGLPGDKIEVRDKRLYINGTLVDRTSEGEYVQPPGDIGGPPIAQEFLEKNPEGVEYTILQAMPEADARPGAQRPLDRPRRPVLHDGRQPRQLARQPPLAPALRDPRGDQGPRLHDPLVLGDRRRRPRAAQLHRRPLLHPLARPDPPGREDPLGQDRPPRSRPRRRHSATDDAVARAASRRRATFNWT